MATPATYEIEGYIFYCHYDGHPIGAAQKLVRMIAAHTQPADADALGRPPYADMRGGLAFAFIRANADSEQPFGNRRAGTRSDYHYTLSVEDDGCIFVQVDRRTERRTWQIVDREELSTWVERQRGDLLKRIEHAHANVVPAGQTAGQRAVEILPFLVRANLKDRLGRSNARYATRDAAEAIVTACGRKAPLALRLQLQPKSPRPQRLKLLSGRLRRNR